MNAINLAGSNIWSGSGTSPLVVTLSSSIRYGNWAYKELDLVFNTAIDNSTVIFVKLYFKINPSDLVAKCYYIYGSHP